MPKRRGVTLIELVIVVLILGILAAVAAPRYRDSLDHFRAEAAARRIVADLELARRTALATSNSRSVQFDTAAEQYVLTGINNPDHPATAYTVRLGKTGYPADLDTALFNGGNQLTFDLYGRPWAGTPLAPLASSTLVVRAGGRQRTIAVDPTTGIPQVE